MKRLVRAVFIGLALLVGVVYGVGLVLPEAHTATVTQEISAGTELVWTALTDLEALPQWRSGLDAVERLPEKNGLPVWTETSGSEAITYEATTWEAPNVLATRIATEGLAFGGGWRIETEQTASGTRVTITESGEVYSPVFRFVGRFILGYETTMRRYLSDLELYVGRS